MIDIKPVQSVHSTEFVWRGIVYLDPIDQRVQQSLVQELTNAASLQGTARPLVSIHSLQGYKSPSESRVMQRVVPEYPASCTVTRMLGPTSSRNIQALNSDDVARIVSAGVVPDVSKPLHKTR